MAKAAIEAHGIPGRLKFFGEPAEKMRGSKPIPASHFAARAPGATADNIPAQIAQIMYFIRISEVSEAEHILRGLDHFAEAAAQVVPMTALDCLTDRALLDAAQAELRGRIAQEHIPPLCDDPPPLQFRWPEYITTARCEDWVVATHG